MLSSVTIKNFKSYRKATLNLAPLTMLIGANASGKSNAIEALRLLSWIAAGNRLGAFRYSALDSDRAIRGNVSELCFRGTPNFSLSCETTESDWNNYAISLECRADNELHIVDERLSGSASFAPLFEVKTPSSGPLGDILVAYNNFARGGRKPQILCSDQMTLLWQLISPARFSRGHKKAASTIPTICRRVYTQLSNITFLDPRPSLMRTYGFKSEQHLGEGGSNLAGVLYNLCQENNQESRILEFVRALPEQDISRIGFIETPRGEVMVKLTETFGGNSVEYDASLLSDGTLRVLAIVAALLSASEGLVVIEKIDNGVHPSRAGRLLSSISRIAKERNLRVLISSHNPALMDGLPDDVVPHLILCYRDDVDGSSRLIRLEDIPDYPELIAQGPVGRLVTQGIIERFVKHHPGSERRKQNARIWLKKLRERVG